MSTFSEQIWSQFRAERNRYLSETDVLVLPDRNPTPELLAYRQTLRDLPANVTDPTDPDFEWPIKPGGTN